MKLTLGKIFKHLALVTRHRWRVFLHCVKCGIPMRGLLHDLSKFSPAEFFESARYYQGNRSPIGVCRRENGRSLAWLHHKGRNPHHIEYWFDEDCEVHPMMPYKYAVECICDKLAATKTYAGKDYKENMPLRHWTAYGSSVSGNERTKAFIVKVFSDLTVLGEKAILNSKYMKKTYAEICLGGETPSGKEELPLTELENIESKTASDNGTDGK